MKMTRRRIKKIIRKKTRMYKKKGGGDDVIKKNPSEYSLKKEKNLETHTTVTNIIENTVKKPTIVNEESNFVVITYWWGRGNKNNNTTRACISTIEKYISDMTKIALTYIPEIKVVNWKLFSKRFFSLSADKSGGTVQDIVIRTGKSLFRGFFEDVFNNSKLSENYDKIEILNLLEGKKKYVITKLREMSNEKLKELITSFDEILNSESKKGLYDVLEIDKRDREELIHIANEIISKVNKNKFVLESRHIKQEFEFKNLDDIIKILEDIWIKYLELCNEQTINPLREMANATKGANKLQKNLKSNDVIPGHVRTAIVDYKDKYLKYQKLSKELLRKKLYAKNKVIPKFLLKSMQTRTQTPDPQQTSTPDPTPEQTPAPQKGYTPPWTPSPPHQIGTVTSGGGSDLWGKYNGMSILDAFNSEFTYIEPWLYNQMIDKWEVECANNNCNFLSVEYPEFAEKGGYQLAINAKPQFIRKALELCEGRSVVYIDGDMFIRKYPKIFDIPNIDFMARGWNMDPRASWNIDSSIMVDPYLFETSGGIMYFSQSKQSKALLDIWIERSQSYFQKGKADDRILSLVFNSYEMLLSMRIIQLPIEYLWLSIDFDERMLEMYDWNDRKMKNSIIVEHAECLTSEETASSKGASNDRNATFTFVNDEAYLPISELLHEYVLFPSKEYVDSFRTYIDYLNNEQYRESNDMSEYLEEMGFMNPDEPEDNARPFYVIPYDKKYGDRNHPAHKDKSMNSIAKINNNIVKTMKRDSRIKINLDIKLYELTNKDKLNVSIVPTIIYYLENNIPVLFSKNPEQDPFYEKIKNNMSKYTNYDIVFYNKSMNENSKHISLKFKPVIDTESCILFMPGSTTLLKLLYMSSNLQSIATLFEIGSYQFVSLLRIKYLQHGKKLDTYDNRTIPYKIHQIWIGENMPTAQTKFTNEWKKIGGYKYKLWGDSDITKDNFPKTFNKINEIMKLPKIPYAMIADLMRLEILFNHGGIYLDTTIEKIRGLPKLNNNELFVISNEIPDPELELPYISNSFIASIPKHNILKRLLEPDRINNIDIGLPANKATGPYYLRTGINDKSEITYIPTKLIYPFRADYKDDEGNDVSDLCIKYEETPGYDYIDDIELYIKKECDLYPDAYMIKHWDIGGSWIKKDEEQDDADY
tara:strand:- start:933 stop:4400 length:3468 start_codon:yes stop_codon:yes gene_type:complete